MSDATHNISGDQTQPIVRTKSIHRRIIISVGRGVTMYVKLLMSAERRRHQWKASKKSHLESHTKQSEGSGSQIFCRNQGRHSPNFMALGAVDF